MLRLNSASARAFHAAAAALATACGPAYAIETDSTGARLLLGTSTVACSVPAPGSVREALDSLRQACLLGGLLPMASEAQRRRLLTLYNSPKAKAAEKRDLLARLCVLRADEAEQLAADFEQELRRRGDVRFVVIGEAYLVPLPQAA